MKLNKVFDSNRALQTNLICAPLLLAAVICISSFQTLHAQSCAENSNDFNEYYYRKKTHFETLPDTKNEIIFLGDSITDGANWTELFDNNLSIKNRGISADVTLGVLCRMEEVLASKPAKIFLMIGTNDLAKGKSVEYVLENHEKLIQQVQQQSSETELFVQSILPVNPDFGMFEGHMKSVEEIKQVNEGLAKLAKEYEITFINLYPEFTVADSRLNPDFTNDGLHLTGPGYQKWKALIEEYL
jgi:lysophospholipase L1-like esterase